jgi:hypothetical protein
MYKECFIFKQNLINTSAVSRTNTLCTHQRTGAITSHPLLQQFQRKNGMLEDERRGLKVGVGKKERKKTAI